MQTLYTLLLKNPTIKAHNPKFSGLVEEIDIGNNITIWQGLKDKTLYKVIHNDFTNTDEPEDTEIKGSKNVVAFVEKLLIKEN